MTHRWPRRSQTRDHETGSTAESRDAVHYDTELRLGRRFARTSLVAPPSASGWVILMPGVDRPTARVSYLVKGLTRAGLGAMLLEGPAPGTESRAAGELVSGGGQLAVRAV